MNVYGKNWHFYGWIYKFFISIVTFGQDDTTPNIYFGLMTIEVKKCFRPHGNI